MTAHLDHRDRAWSEVDAYIGERLLGEEAALAAALAANARGGLPAIDVSPPMGKMLHLLARMAGARRILEVGTLGGYSTIWLARALPVDGQLITLEIDPHHAGVARVNLKQAGCAEKAEVIVGPALESLAGLEGPFDLVFVDADKQSNVAYVQAALRLARPGTVIVVDNVVREGRVLDAESREPNIAGTRALYDYVASEPRLSASALQTVGSKGWDGFLLAIVDG